MRRWRTGLAGAIGLMAAASPATAQTPREQPAHQPERERAAVIILDPRIADDAGAVIRDALQQPGLLPLQMTAFAGVCGLEPELAEAGERRADETDTSKAPAQFDLDMALRTASDAITAGGGAVLVVAKAPSACLSIGCALASSLKEADPALRIDVLALGSDAEPLHCLADNTGGRYHRAEPGTLHTLIVGLLKEPADQQTVAGASAAETAADGAETPEPTVVSSGAPAPGATEPAAEGDRADAGDATNGSGFPPLPKPRPERVAGGEPQETPASGEGDAELKPFEWAAAPPGAPEKPPPQSPDISGVKISILAGPSGPSVETDLAFEILSPAGDGTFRRVAQSTDPSPFFPLSAGNYIARVSYGDVVREFPFSTDGGVDSETFSLGLGYVSLQVRPTASGAPLESGISYTVSRLGSGAEGAAMMVRREPQPMITLPAGRYRILAQAGGIKTVADLIVSAGNTLRHAFNLKLGYLRVSAPPELQDVALRVEDTSKNGKSDRRVLATANGSTGLFRLPAGRYIVVATSEAGQTRERADVRQGKMAEVMLEAPARAERPKSQ